MLSPGIKGKSETVVDNSNIAKTIKSGSLEVFATPAMIALMEEAAYKSVADEVGEGNGTVGTYLSVSHLSASPVGIRISCESELTAVEGRKLIFSVKVYDDVGLIGEGEHHRFIVANEKFQNKANQKLKS
ncbi:MAG: thioesterase family protein [Clostridiales bacterium]|nr:thioesterase family protein [Clostridiales bacterium]